MTIDVNSTTPIYLQVADLIENMILEGSIQEEEQVPSTTHLSQFYNLNPATVRKGFNLLVDEQIIYKKRGLGMFVSEGALGYIQNKRKEEFYSSYVVKMLNEGHKLGITANDIITMIKNYKEGEQK